MPELFNDVLRLSVTDAGTIDITGGDIGPAGAHVVEIDGLVLIVDAAEPETLSELEIHDESAIAMVSTLLGADAEQTLRRHVAQLEPGMSEMLSPDWARYSSLKPPGSRQLTAFGRAMVASSVVDDPDATDATVAAAFLDLLRNATASQAPDFWRPYIATQAAAAAQLVASSLDELVELAAGSRQIHRALTTWPFAAVKAAGVAIGPVSELVRTARSLPEPFDDGDVDMCPPPSMSSSSVVRDGVVIVEPNGLEVTLPGAGDGWWLEVRARGGLVPLAFVPFLAEEGRYVAQTVLPARAIGPAGTSDRLRELEVLAMPTPPRPIGQMASRSDHLMAAVRAGRQATLAERAKQPDFAVNWWEMCSAEWETIGDEDRAAAARGFARQAAERSAAAETLISDLVSLHPSQC
jgi:hypothetical protein